MTLTQQDYTELEQLNARYVYAVDECTRSGYAYADLYTADIAVAESQNWMVIGVFLVVALVANALAGLARVGERFFVLSPDLLCITGPERVIRINPAFSQILGYSIDDLADRHYLDLVVPEDRDRVRVLLEQLPGRAEPVRFEDRVICRDFERWVEWSVVCIGAALCRRPRRTERRRDQAQTAASAGGGRGEQRRAGARGAAGALRRVARWSARGQPPEMFQRWPTRWPDASREQRIGEPLRRRRGGRPRPVSPRSGNEEQARRRRAPHVEGDNIATRVIQAGAPRDLTARTSTAPAPSPHAFVRWASVARWRC
jgi:PAS domain S-box-containing protein